jgi:hypothetical protein
MTMGGGGAAKAAHVEQSKQDNATQHRAKYM